MNKQKRISDDKLAVLTVGIGAVSSTLFAGVEAIKRGLGEPVGSYTQLGKLPKKLPLARLQNIVFGGWDIFPDDAYEAAQKCGVLDATFLKRLKTPLSKIKPMRAVFDSGYVKLLKGKNLNRAATKMGQVSALRADIRGFMKKNKCARAVLINCASTEARKMPAPHYRSVEKFEEALRKNLESISPFSLYAYAALKERVPVVNATPNAFGELPFIKELAEKMGCPIAGSDLKTGQTLLKTVLAPALRKRFLGVKGWFSTNILGNRDGYVLSDAGSFETKALSKMSALKTLLPEKEYPSLYGNLTHVVNINYYPPRGDDKEGWDNIDLFGWLGYPMQIKINFLCRDSILAAPLVLDLALLLDFAKRAGLSGPQDWLGFYFKSPLAREGREPEHDLSVQFERMEKQLERLLPHRV